MADQSKRRPISLSLRFSVYDRDKHTCQYCGRRPPEVVLQLDHVYPVKLGGKNKIDNLLTACRDCNIGKGARDPGLAMPSRPMTYLEISAKFLSASNSWAMYWPGPAWVRALMFVLGDISHQDRFAIVEPHKLADLLWVTAEDLQTAIDGLTRAGAIMPREGLYYEIRPSRGNELQEVPWGLGGCFAAPDFLPAVYVHG